MKALTLLILTACAVPMLIGCGSSSDEDSSSSEGSAPASASAQDRAAKQVCNARNDVQAQVQTLTTLSAGSASKADVTSALSAIRTDLRKMKDAQSDLAPERRQEVQDAAAAFETELKDIARQTVAGLATGDAKTQAANAAASLKSAVNESLQPIDC